jgi:signal transduction histidine kinase
MVSSADLSQDAAEIERAGRQLLGLIDAVLDATRLDPDRTSLHPELVDLDGFVEELYIATRPAVERNDNTFDVVKPAALGTVVVDPARLRGALRPLLDNAAKFTRHGRVTLRCERDPQRSDVRFQVIDTGPGIPAADLARIRRFEPFSPIDASPARPVDGIGLGLVVAARSCALLGGRLAIDSVSQVGTTATVEIPDEPAAAGDKGAPSDPW